MTGVENVGQAGWWQSGRVMGVNGGNRVDDLGGKVWLGRVIGVVDDGRDSDLGCGWWLLWRVDTRVTGMVKGGGWITG